MTAQKQRDQHARILIAQWKTQGPSREQVCAALTAYTRDPGHLHLAPHLVTQCRLQRIAPGFWS